MVEGNEHESTDADSEEQRATPAEDRPEKPVSFDFKLRLGSRESTAALAGRATGELVQLQPIDWDSFTGLRDDDAPREYKTDGDLPSIIVELANQIAGPDTLAQAAMRMNELATNRADPEWKIDTERQTDDDPAHADQLNGQLDGEPDPIAADPAPPEIAPPSAPELVVATVDDDPMLSAVVGQILDEPAPPAAAPPAPAAQAPAAVAPAPAVQAPAVAAPTPIAPPVPAPIEAPSAPFSAVAPAVRAPVQEVPEGPIEIPRIVALTPDLPSGEMAQAPMGTPPSVPVSGPPSGPVSAPVFGPATGPGAGRPSEPGEVPAVTVSSSVKMVSGVEAMAMATTAAPAPPAPIPPLQLAKIERKPGAERPTKPVDFHALLGQAGLSPQPQKRRKKRHPFRVMFKLIVVLGIIGGGLFFGKKYILDMRWDSELKPYADAVAESRELEWKKAITTEVLPMTDYVQRLSATALGPVEIEDALEVEWRSMGLIEGELDLDTVGEYSATMRPVMYDPIDRTIYELDALPDELRDHFLYTALGMALLDQHFDWSAGLGALNPSARAGRLALIDADASQTALRIEHPSESDLEQINAQATELLDDADIEIGGSLDYPTDLIAGPRGAAQHLFEDDVVRTVADRDKIIVRSVSNDGAVLDALRGLTDRPVEIGDTTRTAGMAYWYYVLAGRLSAADAWNAAVAWDGDETLFESTPTGGCVAATISAVDEPGRVLLLNALQRWAAAGPPESAATVAELGTERIEVHSCDPGPAADTRADGVIMPWGLADAEYALVDDLALDADRDERTCVINAVRNFGLMALPAESAPQFNETLTAIRSSCAAA